MRLPIYFNTQGLYKQYFRQEANYVSKKTEHANYDFHYFLYTLQETPCTKSMKRFNSVAFHFATGQIA